MSLNVPVVLLASLLSEVDGTLVRWGNERACGDGVNRRNSVLFRGNTISIFIKCFVYAMNIYIFIS